MPFFSKLKQAKEASAEHKMEAAVQEQTKSKVLSKRSSIYAGNDALPVTPPTARSDELRERIAAARRSRSTSSAGTSVRCNTSLYNGASGHSSRPASIISSTSHSRNGSLTRNLNRRTNSDLSISTMVQLHQDTPSRGRQPVRNDGFSHPSDVPAVPQIPAQHRPKPQRTISSRSSITKKKSPLSAMSINEDDEVGEPSSSSSERSDASVASSQSSVTEISRPSSSQDHNKDSTKDSSKEGTYSRPLSTSSSVASTLKKVPQTPQVKRQSILKDPTKPQPEKERPMKRFSFLFRRSMDAAIR